MLFTVTGTFSDFTCAIEQYESDTPSSAVSSFLADAAALSTYDSDVRRTAIERGYHEITHMADGLRGVWSWHLTILLERDDVRLLGGTVVLTESNGPIRGADMQPKRDA